MIITQFTTMMNMRRSLGLNEELHMAFTVIASVTVTEIYLRSKKIVFETVCKVRNKVVTSGTAKIFMPEG